MAKIDGIPSAVIRQWARQQGMSVGKRGRLHPDIVSAYRAEHNSSAPSVPTDISQSVSDEIRAHIRVDRLELMLRSRGTHISQQKGWRAT